nr:monodehydroascorbate reductase [Tanacetum cinerariifolium]
MADVNAPSDQTLTMDPPVRTDDQILPHIRWIPIGKSNCYLDLEKSQSNPIYKIAVDLLKNTNFFRAFTTSSNIPSIYIQQFWDTILYDKKAGCYKCQLDEQWFDLTKETLREALQITPVNRNQAFATPPSINGLINFVNQLGYPKLVVNLSTVVTNDLFQPWRALLTIINLCLTGKTSGFERPRAHVLQILWGIVTGANIDYAERIWEEFTQSIHTFIEDKRNLSRHTSGKKRATLIVISSVWFTKLIIHHLQRKHRFYPRPDSPLHLSNEEPVLGYLKFSAKGTKREIFGMPIPGILAGETRSTQDLPAPKPAKPARKPQSTAQKAPPKPSISSPVTSTQPAPTSVPAKTQENKRKQATRTTDKPVKAKRIKRSISRKTHQSRSSPKSMGESEAEGVPAEEPQGPLPPVVIRELESGKYQPLPEVPGKGKAKVSEEQVVHDLLSLQKHKKASPMDQYIFQRRVSEPTASSFHDVSPYEVLGQSDSKDESKKIVLGIEKGSQDESQARPDPNAQTEGQTGSDTGAQAEGQAGSNPDETSKGQARSNLDETSEGQEGPDPGNAEARVQSTSSPVVHAGSDRKHMDIDVANVSIAVSEVVTDAVDWAMQAPLRNRFRDLLEADMKEILHQRMWETDSYKSHEVHMQLFEALEKSINLDQSEEVAYDLAEVRKKRKKGRESPKTPPGLPSHQPPPHPPPAGPSGTSGAPRASGSQVIPPPPPPTSTNQDSSSTGSAAPSLAKTAATTKHQAWLMLDVTLKPLVSLTPEDIDMDEAMGPDEQAQLSNEKDIRSARIPTVNLRQGWWKPFEEE